MTSIDRDKPEAFFKSSRTEEVYRAALKDCTCMDFAFGHTNYPRKHILRLADELGLLDTIDKKFFLPEKLREADEKLIEKYVTLLHFAINVRPYLIKAIETRIKALNKRINALKNFQDEAGRLKHYKSKSESDSLLDELAEMGLVEIIANKTKTGQALGKTDDIEIKDITLAQAEAILDEYKDIYPLVFQEWVTEYPGEILENIRLTLKRSEKILRPHDAKDTPEWAFYVPDYFNDALDIYLLPEDWTA